MLDLIGERVGVALASFANIFNPEAIVLGGGVMAAGEMLLAPARARDGAAGAAARRSDVAVLAARFGAEAGHGRRGRTCARRSCGPTGAAMSPAGAAVSGKLIVCPTPIGNLEDITLRVLAALREADLIACEDTRRTGALLKNYGVSGKLVSYYEQQREGTLGRAGQAHPRR